MTINKAIYFTVAMLAVCSSIFPQTGLKPFEFSSSIGIVFPGKIEGSYESDFPYNETNDTDARKMGFAFDGNMELSYRVGQNLKALVELGFLSQLYGGIIDVAYIRSGMVPYASVGVGIGM